MSVKTLKVVAVSGSLQRPSRTVGLVDAVLAELGRTVPIEVTSIELSRIGPQLGAALTRSELGVDARAAIDAIEGADVLVAASPVYRASYTGLFKHLFDFVHHEALVGVPVLLAATGGSERHALMLDHQLRPLFGFFQALSLPIGVYAVEQDFDGQTLTSPAVHARIALAVARARPWLRARHDLPEAIAA